MHWKLVGPVPLRWAVEGSEFRAVQDKTRWDQAVITHWDTRDAATHKSHPDSGGNVDFCNMQHACSCNLFFKARHQHFMTAYDHQPNICSSFNRMEGATRKTCYEGTAVQNFKLFMERSREHEVIVPYLSEILQQEFNRYSRTDGGRPSALVRLTPLCFQV